eukprot:TRINITY_DN8738_c0_g1_i1.p1 TRINITY_DN8738_c0_g1~~TRINITY_DN8738_c0_g1_i1.p1  ORF type:complete len:189 (+),score=25.03 TRINITY_DN8738_c0_g1_i1:303-869(+)
MNQITELFEDLISVPQLFPLGENQMEESESHFSFSLFFLLGLEIVYMYYLDWNSLTLLWRLLQFIIIYHATRRGIFKNSLSLLVIFSNIPVIILHLFSQSLHLITLNFIGEVQLASIPKLLCNDFFIILIELVICKTQIIRRDYSRNANTFNNALNNGNANFPRNSVVLRSRHILNNTSNGDPFWSVV